MAAPTFIDGYQQLNIGQGDQVSNVFIDKQSIWREDGNGAATQMLGGGDIKMVEIILDRNSIANGYYVRAIEGKEGHLIIPIYGVAIWEGSTSPFADDTAVVGFYEGAV